MDIATLAGIAFAFVCIVVGLFMEGGNLAALIEPSAAIIVIGGTFGAAMASNTLKDALGLPNVIRIALMGKPHKSDGAIAKLVEFAEIARRDGLLGLEQQAKQCEDPFMKRGLQMAVDGTDPEEIQAMLWSDIGAMKARHKSGAKFLSDMAGFGPTLGIIGTVIGLVHLLENLDDPATAGPAIAVAFIATLYGVLTANLLFMPMANKLKALSSEEVHHRQLVLDGILAIQAGSSPRLVRERLVAYLPPKQRPAEKAA